MEHFLIALVFMAGALTQSLSGFGSALVAMPLLLLIMPAGSATPLMVLGSGTLQIFLLLRLRKSLNISAVWRLAAASFLGIPLGVWALEKLPGEFILGALGAVLTAYALYALFKPRLPELRHNAWAYGAGFFAGLLGGAYATNGPPAIVYGTCRKWGPEEFKSNLQGFFMSNNLVILAAHAYGGHLTSHVWKSYFLSLPGLAVGLAAGIYLERRIDPKLFRNIVLCLLVVLGGQLLLSAIMKTLSG